MISSQSVPLLAILASSLTLTCLSLNKSTLFPNLVIFTSETSVEFVIFFLFLQPQPLQIHLSPANLTTAIHFTLASHNQISTNFQRIQNSLARVITNTSKYQHITPTLKKLHKASNQTKNRITNSGLLTYKTLKNQQPTYLYNSLSFPSHSVSTRSSDSLVLSIPYVRSSLGKRAFSVIGPRLWNSLPPDTRNSNSLPTFCSRLKTHLFKIAFPPLGSFPSPWTVYPDFDSCYSHFMPYRMTPSVRHRAYRSSLLLLLLLLLLFFFIFFYFFYFIYF